MHSFRRMLEAIALGAVLAVLSMNSGCDKPPKVVADPAPDPWQARLDALQKAYEANQAKLLADWRSALRDAQSRDLDADSLSQRISDLQQQVNDDHRQLDDWNRELVAELNRRGISTGR